MRSQKQYTERKAPGGRRATSESTGGQAAERSPANGILQLNRRIGNRATMQLLKSQSGLARSEQQTQPVQRTKEKQESIPEYSSDDFEVLQIFDSGSTKPQKIKMKNGEIKVIKYGKDEGHLQTEVLSNKLYGKAGIPVLNVELIKVDGKMAQMTDFVESFEEPQMDELMSSEDFIRHVGADMLFANWDLFKTANWMKIKGRMIRSDNGGALDRKAQGDMKDKEDWNDSKVNDFKSMREKKNSPYSNITDYEIADSIRTLAFHLTPEKIDEALQETHFPLKQGIELKKTILSRLQIGLDIAKNVYPLESTVEIDPKKSESWSAPKSGKHSDPLDVLEQMEQEGWQNVPDFYNPELLNAMLSFGIVRPPDEGGKTGNPFESLPMVGPEELLRKDQFGDGLNKEMAQSFARMKTGRLVRRMSDKEKEAFEKSAASEDMQKIVEFIFPGKGKPGERGEMVWSVNDPYIFDREKSELKGETYSGSEKKHDPANYHWIMEIYITDDMLQFLQDYSYINNPTKGSKPSAFMGNPTLKKEGNSGGRGGEEGIPNIVIKKDGFSKFWSSVRKFQFVKADDHMWKHRSNNEELKKIRIEQERKLAGEKRREEKKKLKEHQEEVGDIDFNFDDFANLKEN